MASVSWPSKQECSPTRVKPVAQLGWQDCPEARLPGQLPKEPLAGLTRASQAEGLQLGTLRKPLIQKETPVGVYPALQVGWQVFPDSSTAGQSPKVPSAGISVRASSQ